MLSTRRSRVKRAISKTGWIVVVVIIIVLLAVAGYAALAIKATSSTSSTASTSTSSTSTGQITIGPTNSSQLVDESPGLTANAPYDSLDPGVGFFVTDGYFQNVFQGLVQYNGSASTQVVPSLASSWTISTNLESYTFQMRANTWFSNKDAINAYVAWFSFVRELWINSPSTVGTSNFVSLTFNGSLVGTDGNIWPWGLKAAVSSAFGISISNENALTAALNNMMSNFNINNATQVKVMSYANQAYVASSSSVFQINLIQPYGQLLLALPAQWGAIQDPTFIDAHGGVANNTQPAYFTTNGMVGSGPYMYQANPPAGNALLVLNANPNYWAIGVSGLAPVLAPPTIKTIIMKFGLEPNTVIQDFGSNAAQLATPPTAQFQDAWNAYAYKNDFTFNQIVVNGGYPLCDLAAGLNTQVYPTNITLLREAIVHAVNYSSIEQQLFTFNGTSFGELFLPPVPPGWGPLDNPANTPLYSYNINQAAQFLNQAGLQNKFYTVMANGTTLGNPNGQLLPAIEYAYVVPLTPELQTQIQIVQNGLAQIGIRLIPTGITEGIYEADEASPQTTPNIVGVGWCADWPDPMFQQFADMATPAAHQPSWINNATLNTLMAQIPFETNQATQLAQATEAYAMFTQLSTIIQIPNAASYFWKQPYLTGVNYNPFEFGYFYNMMSYQPVTVST